MENCKIITLCGSTKFKSEFEKANLDLTLQGKIILQPGCYAHADNIYISELQKINLDLLHKEKILLSDCIYVVNKDQYIGSSTKSEIDFAIDNNKLVFYMETPNITNNKIQVNIFTDKEINQSNYYDQII